MNGKPGDDPINDICDYNLPRFSAKADALIRDIHQYLSREDMWNLFDWFNPPPFPELERELELKRDELRCEAEERGWEKK